MNKLEYATSSSVVPARSAIAPATDSRVRADWPKSPRTTPQSQRAYRSMKGSFRWYCARSAASTSGVTGRPWVRNGIGSGYARNKTP